VTNGIVAFDCDDDLSCNAMFSDNEIVTGLIRHG